MKRVLLKSSLLAFAVNCFSFFNSSAQGLYGASSYFNFIYSKVADWSAFTGGITFKTAVDGDSLFFINSNSAGPTRLKGGYTGAVRSQGIELPLYPSLGYLSFYVQNGSSGTSRNLYIKIWDEATSTWVTTETYVVGGNQDLRISPQSALSKKAVKVKIDSDGANFWFHQLEAWSSKLQTSDELEAPKILSFSPVPGSVVSSKDSILVQFDELIVSGTGTLSFSGAIINPVFLGNSLKIKYSGLTTATNTLSIPSTFVRNKSGVGLASDTSVIYLNDVTDPVFQSATPVDLSKIHVNDIAGKIILTFDESIVLGAGAITFGPATLTPVVSGKTLIIGYAGLAYSTTYKLTIPANTIQDKSGNTYKNELILTYTTNDRDNTAPLLISQNVKEGDSNIPIGGSITLTFNEIVKKSGEISINGAPMIVSNNGTVVGINYTNFEYDNPYTVTIPAGALTDTTGNPYAGTTFRFTPKGYTPKIFDIIVSKDGLGNHTTIQNAINAVPDNSTQRTIIFIKNGVYNEKILIPPTKLNLSLIGQDSAKTIITYNDYAGGAGGTDLSYTINVKAKGFYAENLTIKNTWSTTGGSINQAVALMTEGDKQVFKNCRVYGFQDSHYPKAADTRNYYLNCFIEGATDFMFGSATAFFESSVINCVSGGQYITAPSGTTKEFGLVYSNCKITANSNVANQAYYLGRPWKDNGKTVWLNTKMGPHVRDIGWAVWATAGDDADNHLTGYYGEYNSMNLTGTPINPVRAAWGKKLSPGEAARYTIDNVFNFGTGSDSWNPLPYSTAPDAPASVTKSGNLITWDASKYAVGYAVFRNDTLIGSSSSLIMSDDAKGSNIYKVRAINEYGAQSGDGIITGLQKDINGLYGMVFPNPFEDFISIREHTKLTTISIYNGEGVLVKQVPSADMVSTKDLNYGFYLLKLQDNKGKIHYFKMFKQ